jgi:hypothetical protein
MIHIILFLEAHRGSGSAEVVLDNGSESCDTNSPKCKGGRLQ